MCRCENVKMIDRPPPLEEPFAQTLSGKTLDTRYKRKKTGIAKSSVLDEDILCMFSALETRSNAHSVLGRMARTDACRFNMQDENGKKPGKYNHSNKHRKKKMYKTCGATIGAGTQFISHSPKGLSCISLLSPVKDMSGSYPIIHSNAYLIPL